MKKFVLLSVGFEEPTKEVIDAWMKWFEKIGPNIVDSGNPFAPGKEVTKDSVVDLPKDKKCYNRIYYYKCRKL